jgi:hypothetical protein
MRSHWSKLPTPNQWTAEVCPKPAKKLETPSKWAESEFHFQATEIQKRVLDANTKRLMLCCNRQWGKSTVIALKALHYALEHPKSTIVVVSKTEKQGGELISRIRNFSSLMPLPDKRVPGYEYSLQLPNEAKIYAIAHSADSAPSRTANIIIYDEAARVSDEVFSATLPFVATTGGHVWILSTPKGQIRFFYNFWHDRDPQWTKIFSTVEDCPAIPKDFLDLHRRANPQLFRQEFYCEFKPAPGSLTSREFIRQAYDPALSARKLPPLSKRW